MTLRGQVIGIEPKIDPNSRLVTIRAEVTNPEGAINPGQFLRVRVELPEEDGVIALPQTVVTSNLYGDSVYIVRTEGEGDAAEEPRRAGVRPGRAPLRRPGRDPQGRQRRATGWSRPGRTGSRAARAVKIDNTRQPGHRGLAVD